MSPVPISPEYLRVVSESCQPSKQRKVDSSQRKLHVGCRVEPFRWEKVSRANTFYWSSLRKELSGVETNPRPSSCPNQVVGLLPLWHDPTCDLRQGKTQGLMSLAQTTIHVNRCLTIAPASHHFSRRLSPQARRCCPRNRSGAVSALLAPLDLVLVWIPRGWLS